MIRFIVNGQFLELLDDGHAASGTINYMTAHFRLSGDWDSVDKITAVFVIGEDAYEADVVNGYITADSGMNLTNGTWSITLVGYTIVDEAYTKRITTNPVDLVVTDSGNISGEPFPPSAGLPLGFLKTDQSEDPQTIIGGVPKLAEDRVISDDHHIVDKAYVDGSHPDHNDLGGLQGGDVGEYYHMTQAQNAALHSHDNKADLDSVSGVNTGDQDLSSYAKSEDLHTHANKTDLDKVSGTNTGDQDLSGYELQSNKITELTGESTDDQYPSAKCVRDSIIQSIGGNDALFVAMLSGTAENYIAVMRAWFNANGAAALTEFSSLLDRWYSITRVGWDGGIQFANPSVSDLSTGTKTGDNYGMVCVPSTNTVAGQDDYAGNPLFACVDCNWTIDTDGKPLIQAIDGICGNFERDNPAKLVGVLQMTGWVKYEYDASNITYYYSDEIGKTGYYPLPEAVNLDDTVRTWVVHGKYAMGDDFGCYSGVAPAAWTISHNSMLTGVRAAWSNQYCGKTSADDAFMKLMWWLKYGTWTMDGILNGCCSYYYSYNPAAAETGVERIILTDAQAANLLVGSTICLGSTTHGSYATQCSVVDRKRIVSKESIGGGQTAINIDNGGVTFDTTTALFMTTMHWYTGSCDDVLGNDGSPTNNTSGKEICKVQGIEFRFGAYEIICDTIVQYFNDGANKMRMCACRDASKLSTAVTADYIAASYAVECPASDGWNYVKELGHDADLPEVMAPKQIGGSSSTYMRDTFYIKVASSGEYEWPSLGRLLNGVPVAGLSCGSGYVGLASASWGFASRLSSTGNRGGYTV